MVGGWWRLGGDPHRAGWRFYRQWPGWETAGRARDVPAVGRNPPQPARGNMSQRRWKPTGCTEAGEGFGINILSLLEAKHQSLTAGGGGQHASGR
jgi:hypothetical protein